jgi:glycosyltransferase involved in cell wall biosynthesis
VAQGDLGAVPVTFVSSHALLGGSERYLELLLEGLGRDWVAGVVALQDGPLCGRMRAAGHRVDVVETGTRLGLLAGAWATRRAFRAQRPAVVHANGVKAALVSVLALAGMRVPVVWVKHDYSWDGALARLIARRCRTIVAVSSAVADTFRGGLQDRVRVVFNGIPDADDVDRPSSRAELTALLDSEPATPIVVLVGRIDAVKGQEELLEALASIHTRVPAARLAFVGADDPNHREYALRLRRRIAELGFGGVVRLLGHRDDAVRLIAGADVLVVPTVRVATGKGREGFGLTAVEAMAVGTPVVAYGHGALPEVVGECGLLVAPGDRQALASAITDVLLDPALATRLADCGRRRFRLRYRAAAMVEAMAACYREAAG